MAPDVLVLERSEVEKYLPPKLAIGQRRGEWDKYRDTLLNGSSQAVVRELGGVVMRYSTDAEICAIYAAALCLIRDVKKARSFYAKAVRLNRDCRNPALDEVLGVADNREAAPDTGNDNASVDKRVGDQNDRSRRAADATLSDTTEETQHQLRRNGDRPPTAGELRQKEELDLVRLAMAAEKPDEVQAARAAILEEKHDPQVLRNVFASLSAGLAARPRPELDSLVADLSHRLRGIDTEQIRLSLTDATTRQRVHTALGELEGLPADMRGDVYKDLTGFLATHPNARKPELFFAMAELARLGRFDGWQNIALDHLRRAFLMDPGYHEAFGAFFSLYDEMGMRGGLTEEQRRWAAEMLRKPEPQVAEKPKKAEQKVEPQPQSRVSVELPPDVAAQYVAYNLGSDDQEARMRAAAEKKARQSQSADRAAQPPVPNAEDADFAVINDLGQITAAPSSSFDEEAAHELAEKLHQQQQEKLDAADKERDGKGPDAAVILNGQDDGELPYAEVVQDEAPADHVILSTADVPDAALSGGDARDTSTQAPVNDEVTPPVVVEKVEVAGPAASAEAGVYGEVIDTEQSMVPRDDSQGVQALTQNDLLEEEPAEDGVRKTSLEAEQKPRVVVDEIKQTNIGPEINQNRSPSRRRMDLKKDPESAEARVPRNPETNRKPYENPKIDWVVYQVSDRIKRQKDYKGARAVCDRYIPEMRADPRFLYMRAEITRKEVEAGKRPKDDLASAIDDYEAALSIDGDFHPARNALAQVLMLHEQGNWRVEAWKHSTAAVKSVQNAPDDWNAWKVYRMHGQAQSAISQYKEALQSYNLALGELKAEIRMAQMMGQSVTSLMKELEKMGRERAYIRLTFAEFDKTQSAVQLDKAEKDLEAAAQIKQRSYKATEVPASKEMIGLCDLAIQRIRAEQKNYQRMRQEAPIHLQDLLEHVIEKRGEIKGRMSKATQSALAQQSKRTPPPSIPDAKTRPDARRTSDQGKPAVVSTPVSAPQHNGVPSNGRSWLGRIGSGLKTRATGIGKLLGVSR